MSHGQKTRVLHTLQFPVDVESPYLAAESLFAVYGSLSQLTDASTEVPENVMSNARYNTAKVGDIMEFNR